MKLLFMIRVKISILFDFQFQFFTIFGNYCILHIRYVSIQNYLRNYEIIRIFLERPSFCVEYDFESTVNIASLTKSSFIASSMCVWDGAYNESHFWRTMISNISDITFLPIFNEKSSWICKTSGAATGGVVL